MITNERISDDKLQYDIDRKATETELWLGKRNKYILEVKKYYHLTKPD